MLRQRGLLPRRRKEVANRGVGAPPKLSPSHCQIDLVCRPCTTDRSEAGLAPGSGAGVDSGRKKRREQHKGLRGWIKCKGDSALGAVTEIFELRGIMSARLSLLRAWCVVLMVLHFRRPVAADLMCGEGRMAYTSRVQGCGGGICKETIHDHASERCVCASRCAGI